MKEKCLTLFQLVQQQKCILDLLAQLGNDMFHIRGYDEKQFFFNYASARGF
jgi:hypothetical protein